MAGWRPIVTRVLAVLALAAGVAAVVAVLSSDDDDAPSGQRVSFVVKEAASMIPGQKVVVGGVQVGAVDAVDPVDRGRAARVTIRVDDPAFQPLRRGTKLEVRWGGTASFANRYVLLKPASADRPPLPDGATLPPEDVTFPVELDEVVSLFDRRVRRDLRRLLRTAGPAVEHAEAGLRRSLDEDRAPSALEAGRGLLEDLVADRAALHELVATTDRVVAAINRADPGIGPLLEGAADTVDAVAQQHAELGATLERAPGTLGQLQRSADRLDRTLADVGDLARRLRPGVGELRRIARPLDATLAKLDEVAPDAVRTLSTATREAPDVDPLLARLRELSPRLESIGRQADKEVGCLRPYTPEIANLALTWGDFLSPSDGKDRLLRAQVQSFLPAAHNMNPYDAATAMKIFPGIRYGFPRPPGYLAGQPWFQPQCGVGPEVLDPTKDQEAKTFNPLEHLPGGEGR